MRPSSRECPAPLRALRGGVLDRLDHHRHLPELLHGLDEMGPAAVWLWPVAAIGQSWWCSCWPSWPATSRWPEPTTSGRRGSSARVRLSRRRARRPLRRGRAARHRAAGLAPLTATVSASTPGHPSCCCSCRTGLVIAYLVNIVRVQLAARVNNVAVFAEIIGTVVRSVVGVRAVGCGAPAAPPTAATASASCRRRCPARLPRRDRRRGARRDLHARRVRDRRGHGRGGRRRPPRGAAGDDRLGRGVRGARAGAR